MSIFKRCFRIFCRLWVRIRKNIWKVSVKEKVKVEGKKRPQMMDVDHEFDMNEVKYTKYQISFK